MAQLLSFLFTTTISSFLALISQSHWIIVSTKSSLHHFQQHLLKHVHTISHFCSGCISYTISTELFLQHYHAFSCTPFVLTFYICSQWKILFHFSCHTFYRVVIGLFYLSYVSHSLFELPFLVQVITWLPFQLSTQLFSGSSMFLFHPLFLAFLLQTVHTFFCFSIVPSFPSSKFVWIPSYWLCHYIPLFLQLSHLQSMAQPNSWHIIPSHFLPSLYIPHNLSILLPPISLLRYTLSTSHLGWSAPCIVINFLVLLSKLFNSSVFHFRILASYLIIETA